MTSGWYWVKLDWNKFREKRRLEMFASGPWVDKEEAKVDTICDAWSPIAVQHAIDGGIVRTFAHRQKHTIAWWLVEAKDKVDAINVVLGDIDCWSLDGDQEWYCFGEEGVADEDEIWPKDYHTYG